MAKAENQIKGSYKNILNEYFNSSIEEKRLGKLFYPNANATAIDIGNRLGFNGDEGLSIGAGILNSSKQSMQRNKLKQITIKH